MAKQINLTRRDMVTDAVDIEENARVADVALSVAEAYSVALADGLYDLWSDVDCWLKAGPGVTGVTANNGYLLRANNTVTFVSRDGSRFAAIAAGAGVLRLHKVS